MYCFSVRFFMVFAVWIFVGSTLAGESEKASEAARKKLIVYTLSGDREQCHADFGNVSPSDLARLRSDANHGIAIRAAWESVRKTLRKKAISGSSHAIDPLRMQRFLGFVQGRLRAEVPQWWIDSMGDARCYECDSLQISGDWFDMYDPLVSGSEPVTAEKTVYEASIRDFRVPHGAVVELKGKPKENGLTIKYCDRAFAISAKLFRAASKSYNFPVLKVCLLDEKRDLLVTHGVDCSPYKIYCLDHKSGKVLWKTKVLAVTGFRGCKSGIPPGQRVGVVIQSKTLYIFGTDGEAAYIEGFSVKNGKPRFRFSTAM